MIFSYDDFENNAQNITFRSNQKNIEILEYKGSNDVM